MPVIQCILCEHWKNSGECHSLSSSSYAWFHDYLRSKEKIFDVEKLVYCKSCKNRLYSIKSQLSMDSSSIPDISCTDLDTMEVEYDNEPLSLDNLKFIDINQNRCVLCNCDVHSEIIIMPKFARFELLSLNRLCAPKNARCCASHLINSHRLYPKTIVNVKNDLKSGANLLPHEVEDHCNDLLALSEEFRSPSYLDFYDLSMTDEEYEAWTGWNKNQFDYMYEQI